MTATPVFPDTGAARDHALMLAARLHEARYPEQESTDDADLRLLTTAERIWRWLSGPAYILLHVGPVTDQETGEIQTTNPGGNPMQLRDNQQVDLSVTLASAKGNEIPDDPNATTDDLVWSVENGTDVVDLVTSGDSRTATVRALDLGSAVVRVTVPGTEPALFATLAVDVIPGPAALVTIQAGEPTEQPTDEPAPGEPGTEPTPEG